MRVLELRNDISGAFRVRLLRRGDPYGPQHRLTYEQTVVLVEFYGPAVDGEPLSEAAHIETYRAASLLHPREQWFEVSGGPRVSPENSRDIAAWLNRELNEQRSSPSESQAPLPMLSQTRSHSRVDLHRTGDRRVTLYLGGLMGYTRKEAQWVEVRLRNGQYVLDVLLRGRRAIRWMKLESRTNLVIVLGWDHPDLQPRRQPEEYFFPHGQQIITATLTGPKYAAGDPRFEQDFESELDAYLKKLPLAQVLLDSRGKRASSTADELVLDRSGLPSPSPSTASSSAAVFVSYYHGGDAAYRERFEREHRDVIRSSSIYPGEISSGPEVRREIRKRIAGCAFLVVLIGLETYTRRWVDWEIHAALDRTSGTAKPVVGVLLPEMAETGAVLAAQLEPVSSLRPVTELLRHSDEISQELLNRTGATLPARLLDNLLTGYATLMGWPASPTALTEALAAATGGARAVNSRRLFVRNLSSATQQGRSEPQVEPLRVADVPPPLPSTEPRTLHQVRTRIERVPNRAGQRIVAGPDGTWLATASEGLVEIWERPAGTRLHVFDGMRGDVDSVVVSPRGDWIAAVDELHVVRVWSIPSYELLLEKWAGAWGANVLTTDPQGCRLVVGGYGKVQIWEVPGGKQLHGLTPPGSGAAAVFYGPGGRWLGCVGGNFATLRIWPLSDVESKVDLTNRVKEAWIGYVVVEPANRWLATAGGSAVQIWDPRTGKRLLSLTPPGGTLKDLVVGPEAQWLACIGSNAEAVRMWPGDTTSKVERIEPLPRQAEQWTTTGTQGAVQIWSPITRPNGESAGRSARR